MFPHSGTALRQIPSISSTNRASASMVALFLIPVGLSKGFPERPFLNFLCFYSVLSGIALLEVFPPNIMHTIVSCYRCIIFDTLLKRKKVKKSPHFGNHLR